MRRIGGRIALTGSHQDGGSIGGFALQHMQHSYAWWPTLAVLIVATVTDIRSRRIPNWLVFPFLLGGLVVSTWIAGWHGLGQSLGGMLWAAVVYGYWQ